MKTVFKYELAPLQTTRHLMPLGGVCLATQFQGQNLCVWVQVEIGQPLVAREFQVIGTGHEIPENGKYVGTVQEGPYVWHVYDLG